MGCGDSRMVDFQEHMALRIDIANMVCRHCVEAVTSVFSRLGVEVLEVGIGYAVVNWNPSQTDLDTLDSLLAVSGFTRIKDANDLIVEKIKQAVMHHVRDEEECRLNLSACVEKALDTPFSTLSRIFSQKEGRTVEKYHIAQKVERVKELIDLGNLTLSEVAHRTGYSSVAHLSSQFKAETGMTPSLYKALKPGRKPLNEL